MSISHLLLLGLPEIRQVEETLAFLYLMQPKLTVLFIRYSMPCTLSNFSADTDLTQEPTFDCQTILFFAESAGDLAESVRL